MIVLKEATPDAAFQLTEFLDHNRIQYNSGPTEMGFYNIVIPGDVFLMIGSDYIAVMAGNKMCYLKNKDFYKTEVI